MTEINRDDLMKLARRISDAAKNVLRVHNEVGLPRTLAEALSSLQRAEALILETAQS